MSGDSTSSGGIPKSPAAETPRSGSGAETALEAMIRKRQLGTNGDSGPAPLDDRPPPPVK